MQDLSSPSGDLDPIERASTDELRTLQLDRLRWSLRHAYANVPHYRAAFDAAGVHPDDCRDLTDLAKFPLTSKADLRVTSLTKQACRSLTKQACRSSATGPAT